MTTPGPHASAPAERLDADLEIRLHSVLVDVHPPPLSLPGSNISLVYVIGGTLDKDLIGSRESSGSCPRLSISPPADGVQTSSGDSGSRDRHTTTNTSIRDLFRDALATGLRAGTSQHCLRSM